MISDVLSDSAHEIRRYLRDMPDTYSEPDIKADIYIVLGFMEKLRIKLDTPPTVKKDMN